MAVSIARAARGAKSAGATRTWFLTARLLPFALAPLAAPLAAVAVAGVYTQRAKRFEGALAPFARVASTRVRGRQRDMPRAKTRRAHRAQRPAAIRARPLAARLVRLALAPLAAPLAAVAEAAVNTEPRDVVERLAANAHVETLPS